MNECDTKVTCCRGETGEVENRRPLVSSWAERWPRKVRRMKWTVGKEVYSAGRSGWRRRGGESSSCSFVTASSGEVLGLLGEYRSNGCLMRGREGDDGGTTAAWGYSTTELLLHLIYTVNIQIGKHQPKDISSLQMYRALWSVFIWLYDGSDLWDTTDDLWPDRSQPSRRDWILQLGL